MPELEKLTTEEMLILYEVECFAAPYVSVKRRSDGVKGTMYFEHMPRFYFDFVPDEDLFRDAEEDN